MWWVLLVDVVAVLAGLGVLFLVGRAVVWRAGKRTLAQAESLMRRMETEFASMSAAVHAERPQEAAPTASAT